VDPVPDPLFLRTPGSAGSRTRDFWMYSQELRPLDHKIFKIVNSKSGCPFLVVLGYFEFRKKENGFLQTLQIANSTSFKSGTTLQPIFHVLCNLLSLSGDCNDGILKHFLLTVKNNPLSSLSFEATQSQFSNQHR
jgi:hypothetical protein